MKNIFRVLIVTFLVPLFLFAHSGAELKMHFCSGILKSVGLNESSCCAWKEVKISEDLNKNQSIKSNIAQSAASCCSIQTLSLNESIQAEEALSMALQLPQMNAVIALLNWAPIQAPVDFYALGVPPPSLGERVDLRVWIQSFTI